MDGNLVDDHAASFGILFEKWKEECALFNLDPATKKFTNM